MRPNRRRGRANSPKYVGRRPEIGQNAISTHCAAKSQSQSMVLRVSRCRFYKLIISCYWLIILTLLHILSMLDLDYEYNQSEAYFNLGAICYSTLERQTQRNLGEIFETYMPAVLEGRLVIDFEGSGRVCGFAIWLDEPGRVTLIDHFSASGNYLRLFKRLREKRPGSLGFAPSSFGRTSTCREQQLW